MGDEIFSLNLTDLDIEELENRIELGQLIPPGIDSADDCNIKSSCTVNCDPPCGDTGGKTQTTTGP